jgi:hypothetical protein
MLLTGCAQPVNPSFPVTVAQAHQALLQMENNPHPLDRPLVIVGGFLDPDISPRYFSYVVKKFASNPRIIQVGIGCCGSVDECRRKIIAAVDEACPSDDPQWTTEVDVIGASLGGLMSRYAAAPSDDPGHPRRLKIARLFTLSSPHSGAKIANLMALNDFHRDIKTGSKFLTALAGSDADAGYELYPYVHLNDEIVGDRNAAPPGRTPLWLSNPLPLPPHMAAMIDDRIWADIVRRLRDEAPFSNSPRSPLPG